MEGHGGGKWDTEHGTPGVRDGGGAAEGSQCVGTATGRVRGRGSGSGGWLGRVSPAEV